MVKLVALFLFYAVFVRANSHAIHIQNNQYKDILVSLPHNVRPEDRSTLVSAFEELVHQSSRLLHVATKDRAYIRSLTVLVPPNWDSSDVKRTNNSTPLHEADSSLTREEVDIFITDEDDQGHPYTLHHEGCGRRALRIYLPSRLLVSGISRRDSVEFMRLWSEFRYGIFPEGGFEADDMYPSVYQLSEESGNRTTGCKDTEFNVPDTCTEDDVCPLASSVMDQHLPPTATHFCENEFSLGPKHDPHSPSKHNLLCNEEGTWLTVLRSPDFASGKNAAPKDASDIAPSFSYYQESLAPSVLVAIDISSRMRLQSRYSLTKNAFSRFVFHDLPDGTELTLFVFGGGEEDVRLAKEAHLLVDERSKITYLEQGALPEEASDGDRLCTDCVLGELFHIARTRTSSSLPSPIVIVVTTQCNLNVGMYSELKQQILHYNIRLQVICFCEDEDDQEASLHTLCSETKNQFVCLKSDLLSDLYRAFSDSVKSFSTEMMIAQRFLPVEDEENLTLSFYMDETISGPLRVWMSGPKFIEPPLEYSKTFLTGPTSTSVYTQKQELLPAWIIAMPSPQPGLYTLLTRRKERGNSPVLVTIMGKTTPGSFPISTKVWVVVLHQTNISPPPVRIFAYVRRGVSPVAGATVVAYVHHPQGEISVLPLLDDGKGDIDITKEDGIYGEIFTDFTNSTGYYNVYIEVKGGLNETTEYLRGPSGYCCGSSFSANERKQLNHPLQRTAGPVTFHVNASLPDSDIYPPSRVTDLRLSNTYESIYVLNWTAVGDDYSQGFAKTYQLKLFPDRSLIRNRFSDSGLEIYYETIEATPAATYGTPLVHILKLPKTRARGVHYFAVRAFDEAGNAGEPSNALPVWVEPTLTDVAVDCNDEPTAEELNSASKLIPLLSLLIWMVILHNL